MIAWMAGGEVKTAPVSEYGKIEFTAEKSLLFDGVAEKSTVWMSHTDYIAEPPKGFKIVGTTPDCPCAAMENTEKKIYAVQFHPEVRTVNTVHRCFIIFSIMSASALANG